MATATINDRVHVSPAGWFSVWRLKHSFGIYNDSGVKVAEFAGLAERNRDMAILSADAIEAKFQR